MPFRGRVLRRNVVIDLLHRSIGTGTDLTGKSRRCRIEEPFTVRVPLTNTHISPLRHTRCNRLGQWNNGQSGRGRVRCVPEIGAVQTRVDKGWAVQDDTEMGRWAEPGGVLS